MSLINQDACRRNRGNPLEVFLKGTLLSTVMLSSSALAQVCHQQQCTIVGTMEDDVLIGTNGDDVICGLAGNDVIKGKKGNDLICGGLGHDDINGGKGANTLVGGRGNDKIVSKSAEDIIFGSQGANEIHNVSANAVIVPGSRKEYAFVGGSNEKVKTKVAKNKNSSEIVEIGTEGKSQKGNKNTKNSKSEFAEVKQFTMSNNTIYAPDGSVFELRGVNIFPWALDEKNVSGIVDCWGFNSVRLHSWILPKMTSQWKDHLVYVDEPLLFTEDEDRYRLYDIAPLIDIYTQREIFVIVDIHDLIGSYFEGEDLAQYIQFLEYFVNRYKDNPYVWIDLHNEPGGWDGLDGDYSSWRAESALLMDTVRAISSDMVMILSGTAWGQDTGPTWKHGRVESAQSALLANAELIQGYENLITTFHMYDQWKFSYDRVKNYVDELLASTDAPVYIGEYGSWNGSSTLQATDFLHTLLNEPGYGKLGRSVWTWSALDQNDLTLTGDGSGYLVDSCDAPTNLSPLGEMVWADNHRNLN